MEIGISVIVPIYNMEKYLERCIKSIRMQTFREMEIILVDDGSWDHSRQLCDQYAAEDRRIKVIHKPNGGLVSARQTGIRAAKGKYIAFVDADDWIEKNMYQNLYSVAEEHHADVVMEGLKEEICGNFREIKNMIPEGIYSSEEERKYIWQNMLSCEDFFCMGILPYLWNKLFCRELVLAHMLTLDSCIKVGEDAVAVYPMLAMAGKIVITEDSHYHYCIRGTSMTGEIDRIRSEYGNIIAVNKSLREAFGRIGIETYVEKQLERYRINNVLTRAYGAFAEQAPSTVLPPFEGIRSGDSIIIYGAGAFGKAIWKYVCETDKLFMKGWLDSAAEKYKCLGLPVKEPAEISICQEDVIVIAVLRKKSKDAIEETLMRSGVNKSQIKWIERDNAMIKTIEAMEQTAFEPKGK